MTTLREAAQQALDALEVATTPRSEDRQTVLKAQAALRKALAQPEPEPVAWMVYTLDGKSAFVTDNPADFTQDHQALPLYTIPPQRQPESEPVVWQFRMRPDWVLDKDFWEPWTNCTKEQAADYQQVPHLHDWTYESRALYTHSPQRKPLTLEIHQPNESGSTLVTARWFVDTPHGWIGAWDREALEYILKGKE